MKKLILTVALLAAAVAPAMAQSKPDGDARAAPAPVITAPPQAAPGQCIGPNCTPANTGFQPAAAGNILIAPPAGGSTIVIAPPAGGK
jgi:hypothetical protein